MRKGISTALWTLLLISSCFFLAPPLLAQISNGSISGYARDPQGLVVPNVKVTVASPQIGLKRTTVTDSKGYYIVSNLPVGTYNVAGELSGFRTFTVTGIHLSATAALSVDIKLLVGTEREQVNVTAPVQQLATDTSVVGGTLNTTQLLDLPVSGRSFTNLVGLLPGVVDTDSFNNFTPSPYGSGQWHVQGSQGGFNAFQLDGMYNERTRSQGFLTGTMAITSIAEVHISTSPFLAEYGRDSGGQINFITKSGTQDFHGTAYEFDRNQLFDARGFFATSTENLKYNNFGGNIGGPIYIPGKWNTDKSKLFFFFAYEKGIYHVGNVSVGYQPPLPLLAGNFNDRLPSTPAPLVPANMDLSKCPGCVVGQPFPGNIIPTQVLSPNGKALASMYPHPTSSALTGNNWLQPYLSITTAAPMTLRLDYNMGRNQFTFRGDYTAAYDWSPQSVAVQPAYQYYDRPKKNAIFDITTTISPTMINAFSWGGTEDENFIYTDSPGLLRSSYGITFPYYFNTPKNQITKIPSFSVAQYGSISAGASYPSFSTGPIFKVQDDLTKVAGSHTFKTGIYYERAEQNDGDNVLVGGANQNGYFYFNAAPSNPNTSTNALADLLLGNFDSYTEIGQRTMNPWRGRMWEAYAQDSWKVRSDFTLQYGLRLSHMPSFISKWNNFQSFNPAYYDPSQAVTVNPNGTVVPGSGNIYNGIVLPGNGFPLSAAGNIPASVYGNPQIEALFHGLPRSLTQTYTNLEPRLGFAWDLGGRHTTVVRGGFGVFYDRIVCNDSIHPGGVPPFMGNVSISNGSVDNPAGGTQGAQVPLVGSMIDPTAHNPGSYQWSFGIQRELVSNLMLGVTYVGNRGVHEPGGLSYNQPVLGASYANPGDSLDYLRPYAGFTNIRNTEYAYNSRYNALEVTLDRRLAKGLQFDVAYTYSKAMDEAEGYGDNALDTYEPHWFRYGRASFDRTNVFNVSYIYQLPFLLNQKGLLGMLGGWELSGITTFQTGLPTTLGVSGDISGTGSGARPVWISNPNLPKSERTVQRYFNTGSIAVPANGTWGNEGRDTLIRPGINDWDMALLKNFHVGEHATLQFRGDFFNIWNHPQFNNVSTTYGSANFGQVTGAQAPRIIQLGAQLSF